MQDEDHLMIDEDREALGLGDASHGADKVKLEYAVFMRSFVWEYVVLDEAHFVRNHLSTFNNMVKAISKKRLMMISPKLNGRKINKIPGR
ncbi:hypothetical protein QBC46DRAFT_337438 [Diplogelasinospora grovesii]|uniref:SNF2 N-terminal domain-containing protein n=1 Tax=Diplogelasinospora grovesii TaxID=303347 RepID=A0AAN6NFA8_9PEZI|nr:hypothetical protein QBC46DRAFT_337438 [Diplogelasinospora grovesii]